MKKIILLISLLIIIALPVLAQSSQSAKTAPKPKTVIITGNITEINSNMLKIKQGKTIYQINLTEKTNFIRKYGGKSRLAEFSIDDKVQVTGAKIDKTVLEAKTIRDISIQKYRATFSGTIKSIDLEKRSFILIPKSRREQTILVDEAVKITMAGKKIVFTDLVVGGQVTASGIWNTKKNIIVAEKIVAKTLPAVKPISAMDKIESAIQAKLKK